MLVIAGVLSLAIAIAFSLPVFKILIGLIVVFDGVFLFQLYTCGGFGPLCTSWWDGPMVGLLVIAAGVSIAAWGDFG